MKSSALPLFNCSSTILTEWSLICRASMFVSIIPKCNFLISLLCIISLLKNSFNLFYSFYVFSIFFLPILPLICWWYRFCLDYLASLQWKKVVRLTISTPIRAHIRINVAWLWFAVKLDWFSTYALHPCENFSMFVYKRYIMEMENVAQA